MFKIMMAFISALKAGNELRYSAAWKDAQVIASLLTAIAALFAAFGYDLHLPPEEILGGAVFISAIANGLLIIMTSKKESVINLTVDFFTKEEDQGKTENPNHQTASDSKPIATETTIKKPTANKQKGYQVNGWNG